MAKRKAKKKAKASTKKKAKASTKKKAKASTKKKAKVATKKKAKVTTKKKAKKKTASKATRSVAAKKVKKSRTKSDVLGVLSEDTGLSKKEVAGLLDSLAGLIKVDIGKKGPGVFSVPGLLKVVRVDKPATKARKGINPFTKEPMMFKAKPARSIVRVRALKSLKDMVK